MTVDDGRMQTPGADCGSETAEVKPSGEMHGGWLHQWLLGEYLAMLLIAHAIMTSVAWLCYAANSYQQLIMVLASGWMAIRCAGGFAGKRFGPVVTLIVLGLTWSSHWADWGMMPAWLVTGPFSQTALLCLIAAVLVIDLQEIRQSRLRPRNYSLKSDNPASLRGASKPCQNHR